ncbi:MAG: single-stranded DNA-binding protein [Verrucomicrobia bacterium]|nr:single-stranded DNA-binding protein [Verrucomicrobiota bacterium]
MNPLESASKILDTMLGHLGIAANIGQEDGPGGPTLQIQSGESRLIIGRNGERLDDLQYLVNRILRRANPDAPRIKVDCEHYRSIREDKLAGEIRDIAERVKSTGRPFELRPLNAYYRRQVYGILADDPGVETRSPEGTERLKRITISPKPAKTQPS